MIPREIYVINKSFYDKQTGVYLFHVNDDELRDKILTLYNQRRRRQKNNIPDPRKSLRLD